MRSIEFSGKGFNILQNARINSDDRLEKTKGISLFKSLTGAEEILYQWEFKLSDGTYQLVAAYKSGSKYIVKAVDESGTLTTPLLEESAEKSITGTLTFTNGSTAVSASGGAFTTELVVGDYIYLDGEYSDGGIIASITDDDNLVLEENYSGTGGAGNGKRATVQFSSSILDFVEMVSGFGLLVNKSTSDYFFKYDGTNFFATSNAPTNPTSISKDGTRASIGFDSPPSGFTSPLIFSRADIVGTNSVTGGANADAEGDYSTALSSIVGIYSAGQGIIAMSNQGAEAHWAKQLESSTEPSSNTKISSFTYTGRGISDHRRAVVGKRYVYFINTDGISEMNPFSGEITDDRPLTDYGKIKRYFKEFSMDNAGIGYSYGEDLVVACVEYDGANDTMIIIDPKRKDRAISVVPDRFYSCFASVNNQLYGGGSGNGDIEKIFFGKENLANNDLVFRSIMEWDGFGDEGIEKTLFDVFIFANLSPRSNGMIVKLFFDGSTIPDFEETFTTKDVTNVGSGGDEYSQYTFGRGNSNNEGDKNSDKMRRKHKHKRFSTMAIEVYESSGESFELYNIKTRIKVTDRESRNKSIANSLFSL